MSADYDVIVVGGGPAGSATAIGLAQRGYHVALLDRARFPRDKACGEFLTPQACHLLQNLNIWDEVIAAGARPVAATTLIAPDGTTMRHEPTNGKPAGYTIRRVILDSVLIGAARTFGVAIHEGFAVRNLVHGEDNAICGISGQNAEGEPKTFTAKIVVGADGSHSAIARQLGLVHPLPRLQRVAIVSHWRNVSGDCDSIEMRSRGDLVCGVSYPEGEAEQRRREEKEEHLERSANVTLVVPTAFASQIAGRKGDFVEQILTQQFPDLASQFAGAERETAVRTVGCFGHRCNPATFYGGLLVGDAATFIDPFTGEGVYFALRGAEFAAETVAHALKAGDTSRRTLMRYDSLRSELRQRYLLCDIVQSVVRRPALITHVVARLKHSPAAADRLLSILGDTRLPKELLHPGLLWRLLTPEIAR